MSRVTLKNLTERVEKIEDHIRVARLYDHEDERARNKRHKLGYTVTLAILVAATYTGWFNFFAEDTLLQQATLSFMATLGTGLVLSGIVCLGSCWWAWYND